MTLHKALSSGITDIILSCISYGFAGVLMLYNASADFAAEAIKVIPNWLIWALVGSVIFMNVTKGVSNLINPKKDRNRGNNKYW